MFRSISKLFFRGVVPNSSSIQKILLQSSTITNELKRNISYRYTIGKTCKPPKWRYCPQTCRKIKKPMASLVPTPPEYEETKETKKKVSKKIWSRYDFGNAKDLRSIQMQGIREEDVATPGQYITRRCDPFPNDEDKLNKKLKKCKASMRPPCDLPPCPHKCDITKGKILYTTNERPEIKEPNCPKGNWNYTD